MDQFVSEQAAFFVTHLAIIQDFIGRLDDTNLSWIHLPPESLQEAAELLQQATDLTILMRDFILMICELLRHIGVRVHNNNLLQLPALAQRSNIEDRFNRFSDLINLLCVLADRVFMDPPASEQELNVLHFSRIFLNRLNNGIEILKLPPHRFGPKGSIKAFLMFSKQRIISRNIKRNWDRFTFPILHKIQLLIINAIDQLELMLRHNNVRVRNYVRLGKPVLPEEPTFRKLFKRLENSVHVLCVLVEADDIKQGSAINEDEMRIILDCRRVLDDLIKNINEFILELGALF